MNSKQNAKFKLDDISVVDGVVKIDGTVCPGANPTEAEAELRKAVGVAMEMFMDEYVRTVVGGVL